MLVPRPSADERSTRAATTLVLVVGGPIDRVGVKALCERARSLVEAVDAELIVCDLGRSGASAATVDVIGRLKLLAQDRGRRVRFVHATPELGELLRLMGLDDVLTLEELSVEAQG